MGKRRESFEAVQRSVVRVKDASGQTWGTGFFISREGHLLTCAHVVEDAGGWKNVRISDQPVNCLYAGDPERDDFCLLQVEGITVTTAELSQDFDPGDKFLSPGFSNDDYHGAAIEGEVTTLAYCDKLGNQELIRLKTSADSQRIEGGQSGAPIFVFQRGKYRAVGVIVASEDLDGGLAIPSSSIQSKITNFLPSNKKRLTALYAGIGLIAVGAIASFPLIQTISLDPCKSSEVTQLTATIAEILRNEASDFKGAEAMARKLEQKCIYKGYYFEGRALAKQKNYMQAIKAFEESLRQKESPEARFHLGAAYGRTSQYEKAIKTLLPLEQTLSFSKEFDSTSALSERNVLFNLAIFHHFFVSENFQSFELSESDKRQHLKEAMVRYQTIFKQTMPNSCGDNAVGNCVDVDRTQSADGLAMIYSLLYGLNSRDRYSLNQALYYLDQGLVAKIQAERQNDLDLLEAPVAEQKFQKDISYIHSTPEFSLLLKTWQQRLRAASSKK